jgi:hypothetical protein
MGYHTVDPLREAPGAVTSASPRTRSERRFRHAGRAWAVGLLLPIAAACKADDLSQTLTTRETQRQQEREQQLQPRTPDVRLQPPAPRLAPERLPSDESPCFEIARIARHSGNECPLRGDY